MSLALEVGNASTASVCFILTLKLFPKRTKGKITKQSSLIRKAMHGTTSYTNPMK